MHTSRPSRDRSGRRETDLVALCARSVLSGTESGLRESLAQALEDSNRLQFDWTKFRFQADAHSVTPLIAYGLQRFAADMVPREMWGWLQEHLNTAARNNLLWLGEWFRLLAVFEAEGIPVISLKGPSLSVQAYGNLALREFADLDFLVRPEDVLRTQRALEAEGFRPRGNSAGDSSGGLLRSGNRQLEFLHAQRGTQIDVHWGVLHEMFSFQLPVDELFRSSRVVRHEEVSFLSLSPEYTLLYLCAHGTKHCWTRMRWLCDVAYFLQSVDGFDWRICATLAESANCSLVLKHSLILAKSVLGMILPKEVDNFFEDGGAQALADKARSFMFSQNGNLNPGETLSYHLAFAKRWHDRARFLHHRIFVPAEPDWNAVRLPTGLQSLYYFVRPVRLLLEGLSVPILRREQPPPLE